MSRPHQHIDLIDELATSLAPLAPSAKALVAARTASALLSANATEVLTFVTPSGASICPEPNAGYVKALWCFLREKPYDGSALDSAISGRVATVTQEALLSLLRSEEALGLMVGRINPGEKALAYSRELLQDECDWLAREAAAIIGLEVLETFSTQAADTAADQAQWLLHTAAGAAIVAAIAKAVSTAAGKALVAKLISAAAAKVMASVALKSVVAAAVKKIGIVLLTKLVIVKVLALAFPAVVAMKVPLLWIITPLVGAFLLYEVCRLPKKLADAVPPVIADKIESSWPEIASKVAECVVFEAARRVAVKTEWSNGSLRST